MKNRFEIRSKFQGDFWSVLGALLVNFGRILRTLNPKKWCSRVSAVLFLRKSRFSDQIRFWIDFFMILDGFGVHFGEPFGIKIASKTWSKNQTDFLSIFDGFWLPIWLHFGPILAPKIDQKSRSIFVWKRGWISDPSFGVRSPGAGSGEGPKDQQDTDIYRSVHLTRPAVLRRILAVFWGPWALKNGALV